MNKKKGKYNNDGLFFYLFYTQFQFYILESDINIPEIFVAFVDIVNMLWDQHRALSATISDTVSMKLFAPKQNLAVYYLSNDFEIQMMAVNLTARRKFEMSIANTNSKAKT